MRRPSGVERHVFVAEEAQLSSAQSAEMLELQKRCFQHIPSQELDQDFDRPSVARVLAYEEVSLVGCAQVFRRFVDYQGSRIDLGGFGGVCTRADRRRQGIGTTVCLAAMDYLRRQRCELAFLAVDSSAGAHRFYEQFGFRLLARPFVYANSNGVLKHAEGGMIAPLCSPNVYEHVMKGETAFALTPERGYW